MFDAGSLRGVKSESEAFGRGKAATPHASVWGQEESARQPAPVIVHGGPVAEWSAQDLTHQTRSKTSLLGGETRASETLTFSLYRSRRRS
jgi:hypothetical protein